ncbi:hypothetical protein BDA96_04G190900 [Sorghum bicolor]|uniref:Uncharacterized protein n=1 Tax=Sorghum bicolor TaxID=4558 RepID=A0A921R642_SORBI|nr:hypothetical protein BDA96_04G190900 [Sorghum bicolor]
MASAVYVDGQGPPRPGPALRPRSFSLSSTRLLSCTPIQCSTASSNARVFLLLVQQIKQQMLSTRPLVVRASLTALDREGPRPARPEQCNATSLPWLPSSLACCIGPVERVGYARLSVGSWQGRHRHGHTDRQAFRAPPCRRFEKKPKRKVRGAVLYRAVPVPSTPGHPPAPRPHRAACPPGPAPPAPAVPRCPSLLRSRYHYYYHRCGLRLVKKPAPPPPRLQARQDNQTNPPGAAKHRRASAPSRAPRLPPPPPDPRPPSGLPPSPPSFRRASAPVRSSHVRRPPLLLRICGARHGVTRSGRGSVLSS